MSLLDDRLKLIEEEINLYKTKVNIYDRKDGGVFETFDAAVNSLNPTPEAALLNMANKHWTSLIINTKHETFDLEDFKERILDLRNYLGWLMALVQRRDASHDN